MRPIAAAAIAALTIIAPATAHAAPGKWEPLTNEISDAVASGVDDPSTIPVAGEGCRMRVSADFETILIKCPGRKMIRG